MESTRTSVCHITTVHAWNDIRIFRKECASLAKLGYDVHLIAPVKDSKDFIENEVVVHPIAMPANRLQRMFQTAKLAVRKAIDINADIYHVHDPELLPAALKLRKLGKKVVYDAHENTAASIYDKEWIPTQFLRTAISNWFERYEQKVVRQLSGVVSVAVPLVDRFDHPNRCLIRNLPVLEAFESTDLGDDLSNAKPGAIYAGGLTRIRNIKEMIQAVGKSERLDVLHLFGSWESEVYRKECEQLPGWNKVEYWGFRKAEEVYRFSQEKGLLGFILFNPKIKNHKIALPNKAFEYMAAGLPIVMSGIPYWQENFGGIAKFVDPFNTAEIRESVDALLANAQEVQRMTKQGAETIQELNWESESVKLKDLYLSL